MDFLLIILTTFLLIIAGLLIGIIMLQSAQDDSSGALAVYRMDQLKMLGAAQAPNILEKATRILAGILLIFILLTSYVVKHRYDARKRTSETIERVKTYVVSEEKKKQ